MPIIFTRYLYLKDEVKLSLLLSILNNKESAYYWAFELYYSGFEDELLQYLWKIYYDFYYTLNFSFQDYFIKKYKEYKEITKTTPDINANNANEKTHIIALIIGNLMFRPHNTDVFMLQQAIKNKKTKSLDKDKDVSISLKELLEKNDYLDIAKFIMERKKDTNADSDADADTELIEAFSKKEKEKGIKLDIDKLVKKWKKNVSLIHVDSNIQFLALVMHLFTKLTNITMGKKLYVSIDISDIAKYDTILANANNAIKDKEKDKDKDKKKIRARQVLQNAYLYKIDEDNYLSLFELERNKILPSDPNGLKTLYWYHWEYYASFSPIWLERIQKCKGNCIHEKKKVEFPENEETDWTEEFYSNFGYEPDEQKKETQEYSIQQIVQEKTWYQFYEKHGKKNIYTPAKKILDKIKSVAY